MFCVFFDIKPYRISPAILCAYLQFLSRSFKAYNTVINYLGAVKVLFELMDVAFPDSTIDLKLIMKGLKRSMAVEVKQAHPIDPTILLDIFQVLNIHNSLDITYWCAFLFLYFLMFRSSQLFPKTLRDSDSIHVLKRKDVTVLNDICLVSVNWSKTIQYKQKRVEIPLGKLPQSPLCPVSAYKLMCSLVPAPPEAPAFIGNVETGLPITYSAFQSRFRHLLQRAKYEPSQFSTHSFRRGAATWAFKQGVPEHLIKMYGDWSSDAYRRYLNVDVEQKLSVFKCMAVL